VLKADLKGPGITAMDVIRATDYVLPCFEIVDSRITDWKIKIQDTVADNASCGVYVLGKTKGDPRRLDITLAGMVLEKNGELFSTGVGAAVQGSPANAVAWLANTLGELGIPFKAGEVILSGSQSALVPVVDGDELVCTVGGLGSCRVKFSGQGARPHERGDTTDPLPRRHRSPVRAHRRCPDPRLRHPQADRRIPGHDHR
jgi:2-oxopent-4-enoate/cis-2-oxohex-4-enoate hydratase